MLRCKSDDFSLSIWYRYMQIAKCDSTLIAMPNNFIYVCIPS